MSSSSTLPHLDLGNTFGALFIGGVLAAVLVYHFLMMQSKLSVRCDPDASHKTASLV